MLRVQHLIFLLFIISCFSNAYHVLSYVTLILLIFTFVNNIGKKLLFVESISLYGCIIYLIVPILGYTEYTFSHPLANLWKIFMQVPEAEYFSFALPAILLFTFSLFYFDNTSPPNLTRILLDAKNSLGSKKIIAFNLLILGIISFYCRNYVPTSFMYPLTILYLSSFAGLLYIYYSPLIGSTSKFFILLFFGTWLLGNAVSQGMFTIIIYMGISIFGILMLGANYSFLRKSFLIVILLVGTLILQYTKANYRSLVRRELIANANISTFFDLYVNNLKHIGEAFNYNSFFPIYVRVNQGYQLARVMDYMPSRRPFDHGSRLGASILASFIPRIFWPNKPTAGGKANMKYYADVFLDTTSMNVGPIGEGYGSFGKWGGILYMFFFGSFLSLSFRYFISLCKKNPLLIFWQPLIFFEVIYCMENDTMQAMNSLIKIGIMLLVLFRIFPNIIRSPQGTYKVVTAG